MRTKTMGTVPDREADVFGMDAGQTLGAVLAGQAAERAGAAAKMRAVTRWADLHRTNSVIGAAIDPDVAKTIPVTESTLGREGELRLAGQGAFMVEEFAVCELATILGMSEIAARAYVGQSLEVRDRLPKCWARVMAGELADWKARQIAAHTIPLKPATAAYVDGQLAAFAHHLPLGRIVKCVEAAILRFEPDLAADRAKEAAENRGVWVEDCAGGISELHAVGDTPDIDSFDTTLDQVATLRGRLGDPDSHQVRRAKALGILADPQYALDLLTNPDTAQASRESTRPTVHLHLHTDSLTDVETQEPVGVARVDKVGPVFLSAVTRWLHGLAAGSTIKLTPVVDLNAHLSVDAYEVPDRLRTQVEHRDPGCVFPWCGRQGRYDTDHIVEFDHGDPDSGRPPPSAQTNTANLARLCRFHHRVKTHSAWTYRRRGPTTVEWTSPHGRRYRVDHTGTINLN